MEQALDVLLLLFQVETFGAAKDYILLALVSLVGVLIGAAWMDVRSKLAALEARLEAKITKDAENGYQRLAKVETEVAQVFRILGRRGADERGPDG